MTKPDETAPSPDLTWTTTQTPVATQFDDPYYSREDGRAESHAVFLHGNGLPQRWQHLTGTFQIAELGFGTGLNFLQTWHVWSQTAGPDAHLAYTSFERWPLAATDIARAISPWPELAGEMHQFLDAWPRARSGQAVTVANVTLTVVIGDARETLSAFQGPVDAWYLDGFSPAANPELWQADLLATAYAITAPGGTFSTYTSAGWVRRNLAAAGFEVEKVQGFGRKRERLQGRRPPVTAPSPAAV